MIRTRAFNYIITIIGILMLCSLDSSAQETGLETGGERKLNVVYKSISQRDLLLDLYYPTSKNKEASPPHPVIIYTHGGGWAAGSKQGIAKGSFAVLFQKLLDHGFAVASVDETPTASESSTPRLQPDEIPMVDRFDIARQLCGQRTNPERCGSPGIRSNR